MSEDGPTFFAQEIHSVFDLRFFCPLFNSGGFYKGRSTYVSKKNVFNFPISPLLLAALEVGPNFKTTYKKLKKKETGFL